jgi:hypothetical protein
MHSVMPPMHDPASRDYAFYFCAIAIINFASVSSLRNV